MSRSEYLSAAQFSHNSVSRSESATSSFSVSSVESSPITVLASSRVYRASGISPGTIVVSQATGKITAVYSSILPQSQFLPDTIYHDYSPLILLPGLVDAHVHLNEPGRTEWEGFYTGTQAAAFGGVTTVIDMPLNAIPPTTTVSNLNEKIAAAQGKCWVDVGFYGGLIPGNTSELVPLVQAGVRGFKGFLIDSGVPEFPAITSVDVSAALKTLSNHPTTIMFHAEMTPPITASIGDEVQKSAPPLVPSGPLTTYQTFLDSRPPAFETHAISQIISLAHLAPTTPLHIVHLSALEAIPLLREARASGVKITAETCPHYLSLSSEAIPNGDTRHKCCPPIRGQTNQDALWDELTREDDSVIKTIVSDHSPCTPDLKLLPASVDATSTQTEHPDVGDFFASWGGIASVGLGLPILFTEMGRRYPGLKLNDILKRIVQWCAVATAEQVGLETRKGKLEVGYDADVVVFDPEGEWCVERSTMLFRNKVSPYQGRVLKGVVRETWLRGRRVFVREGFEEGMFGKSPEGRLLLEPRTLGKQ